MITREVLLAIEHRSFLFTAALIYVTLLSLAAAGISVSPSQVLLKIRETVQAQLPAEPEVPSVIPASYFPSLHPGSPLRNM